MKIILIFLLFFLSLTLGNCSKDNELPNDCTAYAVYVSDDCNCNSYNCKTDFWTTPDEYNRLLNILSESTEPCIYIYSQDVLGNTYEGYLLELEILNIEPCLVD